MSFLLYGANGYTGQIIAEMASQQGLHPVLAGRNEQSVKNLAQRLGFEYRIFDLQDPSAVDQGLAGISLVLHAAGPFAHTARPMMEACLRNRTHYLDITGEIEVFELAHSFDAAARAAGILLMSGTGFDVVPTDCAAVFLKNQMPDATHLRLAFAWLGGGSSRGTALTSAENLGGSGAERRDGRIVRVPLGRHTWTLPAADRQIFTMSIPWGDVSTAWHSTGIPNIVTYARANPQKHWKHRFSWLYNWLLRTDFMKNRLRRRIAQRPAGPSPEQRQRSRSIVWGEAQNAVGDISRVQLELPEGYTLTALTSLLIVQKVLAGQFPIGFQTPAMAFGADLVMEVEGVQRRREFF